MLLALLAGASPAQDYRFPTSDAHYDSFYPTAYYDHGGTTDWDCASVTYSGHRGSDYGVGGFDGMYAGRDIVAAADGLVQTTNDGEYDECTTGDCGGGGGYGNYVVLEHGDGRTTTYAHMKQGSVAVASGERVDCGQKLGEVGSSGNSTGPHLHFEVREASGSSSDPFDGPCSAPPTYWIAQGAHGALPAPSCADAGPCATEGALTCGDVVSGRSDEGGATSEHYFYGCEDWMYSGPERSWTVTTDRDEPIDVTLSGLSQDLDLYALDSDACDGGGCLASSSSASGDESVRFDAAAGRTYVVVLDGWEGAVSDFTLTVDCEGGLPEGQDSAPPEDTDPGRDSALYDSADTDAGPGGGPGGPGGPGPGGSPGPGPGDEDASWTRSDLSDLEKGACGCAAHTGGPPLPLLPLLSMLVVPLALRRRRP